MTHERDHQAAGVCPQAAQPAQAEPQPVALEGKWEGAEEWMPLAWELCAEECGEDACTELVWEGGPVPEPWGDRWLKYEDEAKRLIALVRKCVPSAAPTPAQPAAEAPAVRMSGVAQRKARDLFAQGYEVAGYVLEKDGDRSAVLWDAAVRWITPPERHRLMHVEASLIEPAAEAPARVALPADLIDYMGKHLKHQRELIAGFEALGNEVRRAAKLDDWIAAVAGIQAGTDGGAA